MSPWSLAERIHSPSKRQAEKLHFVFIHISPSRLLAAVAVAQFPRAPAITESCMPYRLLYFFIFFC